jgi:hypothetical protein
MKRLALFLTLVAIAGCVPPSRRVAVAPCSETIAPIRNQAILVVINITYSYTPEDESGARSSHKDDILEELNNLGQPDGNTFAEPNGQGTNFTFTYTINNDGQDHFTGGLHFAGWGQGFIHDFGRYQYSYSATEQLVKDLTDDAYGFIHDGWHDSRPSCAGR